MAKIEGSEGIERRGLVLALLTALKQICNHPAQYLHERGPLAGRSGKLARVTEMLEETLAAGDRVLVFTQYREMGDRLVAHLEAFRHPVDDLRFRISAPAAPGAILRQLGPPPGWRLDADFGHRVSPAISRAAARARDIALGSPSTERTSSP